MVADPLSSRGVSVEEIEKTSTDGRKSRASKKEELVVASHGDKSTAQNGRDGDGNDEGQVANTALSGSSAVDRLEVDGDVVDGKEEGAGEDEGKSAHDPDGSILDDSGGDHGSLALEPLEESPGDDDEAESDKETNDD